MGCFLIVRGTAMQIAFINFIYSILLCFDFVVRNPLPKRWRKMRKGGSDAVSVACAVLEGRKAGSLLEIGREIGIAVKAAALCYFRERHVRAQQ